MSKIKKAIAILLIVLFLVTVTAGAASAYEKFPGKFYSQKIPGVYTCSNYPAGSKDVYNQPITTQVYSAYTIAKTFAD